VLLAQQFLKATVDPVGEQGTTGLDANDTPIGEITPVFQQLVAEPLDDEGEMIVVEQYFSGLHWMAKVRGLEHNIHNPGN
jgi:hypothetical protein